MKMSSSISLTTHTGNNEWLSCCPDEWTTLRTKQVFRLVTEKSPASHGLELLSVYTHIGVRPRKDLEQKGNKASNTDGYWMVKKGDIVVNKLLAWMGAVGVSHFEGVTSPAYDILRAIKEVNSDYYHYLFRTQTYLQLFKSRSRGIMEMRLRLYFDQLGQIPIPVPPLNEQNKIVDFLNYITKNIELMIVAKRKCIKLINEQKKARIQKFILNGTKPEILKDTGISILGSIPSHWDVKRLKYVLTDKLRYGANEPAGTTNPDWPRYIRITDFKTDGTLRDETFCSLHPEIAKDYLVDDGDILFARSGATVGKAFLVKTGTGIACHAGYLIKARPKKEIIYPSFLFYFTQTSSYEAWKDSTSNTATIQNIGADKYCNLPIPLPPYEEQKTIVTQIELELQPLNDAVNTLNREIELLKEYSYKLISEVVFGKLRINSELEKLSLNQLNFSQTSVEDLSTEAEEDFNEEDINEN